MPDSSAHSFYTPGAFLDTGYHDQMTNPLTASTEDADVVAILRFAASYSLHSPLVISNARDAYVQYLSPLR